MDGSVDYDGLACVVWIAPKLDRTTAAEIETRLSTLFERAPSDSDGRRAVSTALVAVIRDRAEQEMLAACGSELINDNEVRRRAAAKALLQVSTGSLFGALVPTVSRPKPAGRHGLAIVRLLKDRRAAGGFEESDATRLYALCHPSWQEELGTVLHRAAFDARVKAGGISPR
jgi:hypothetical protein